MSGGRTAWSLAAWALLCPALALAGDPSLTATLDRDQVGLGETVQLTVRLEADEPPREVQLPASGKDFRVLSQGQSTETNVQLGGAGWVMRSVRTWTQTLEPLHKGTLTIPGPIVLLGRVKLTHPGLRLTVGDRPRGRPGGSPGARPAPGGDDDLLDPDAPPGTLSWNGWQRDLTLRLSLDKKEAWVGEQVTATLELLSPVEVVDWDAYRPPTLEGFWSEDLGVKPGRRVAEVDGVPMRVYLLKKLALFPNRAGTLTVEPAELDVRVQIASRAFGLFPELRSARRKSRAVSLAVKPLPPGAPPGFEPGNVGDWTLAREGPEDPQPAGQPFAVNMTVRGVGNLKALVLPRLDHIPGLQAFDPAVNDRVSPVGDKLGGTRRVETLVALDAPGKLELPAVEWPWFDPKAGKYQVAKLPPLPLEGGPRVLVPKASAAELAELAALLRPLRTEAALAPAGAPAWRSPWLVAALGAAPLGFAGLALGLKVRERMGRNAGERRRRRAARVADQRLGAARRCMEAGDRVGFHDEVAKALLGYAADRLGEPVAGLTREALAQRLARAGAHGPASGLFARVLEAADAGRFGGAEAMPELLARAEEAVVRLEEADWHEGVEG